MLQPVSGENAPEPASPHHCHNSTPACCELPSRELSASLNILNLLKQCTSISAVKQIHSRMLKTGFPNRDNHLLSKLVDNFRDLSYSAAVFFRIACPNDYSYNIAIRGLATAWCRCSLALRLFRRMLRAGEHPNNFTFPPVLAALSHLQRPCGGRAVHSSIFKFGLQCDPYTQHGLITMYTRCGLADGAGRVFDELQDRDVCSWNSIISGYTKIGLSREAVGMYGRMKEEGFRPDEMTLVSVLVACGDLGDLRLGKSLVEFIGENGYEMSTFVGSALIDMFGKCGDLESARKIFDSMPNKDKIVWNAMISGYSQNGQSEEAIKLFRIMTEENVKPDNITLVGVLSATASVGAQDIGRWVDSWADRHGLLQDVYIGTGLVDMYAKCGNLERAAHIFRNMPMKNVVTWNAMISAFAFNGRAHSALSLFSKMEGENIHPDKITFIGVLAACVHAGLVEEGRRWFYSMQFTFGITPQIEHYSCMVDLLARGGHVEEAWSFIQKMPCSPDAAMLGALLSACRQCQNDEVGERVLEGLLELEPLNSGNYIISSKLYANLRRWDDSAKMQGLMRDKGIAKVPGCSWIELLNQLYEFRSGDTWHLTSTESSLMVDLLNQEMKKLGYKPDTRLV